MATSFVQPLCLIHNNRLRATMPLLEEDLLRLTVPGIKRELKIRKIAIPSKVNKRDALLDLLQQHIDWPVDSSLERSNPPPPPKQSRTQAMNKQKYWKMNEPVRKLLYYEFKEGNIPLDANEMGPAEIYCHFHDAPEFAGIEYNDLFIERLRSLRQHIFKEEPLLKWNEFHPARHLLFKELEAGNISLDAREMGPAEVWCQYCDSTEFKLKGMKFNEAFKRRLAALRKIVGKDKDRAKEDLQQVLKAFQAFPPPTHNHRGEPQWNGSDAQKMLKEDVKAGLHKCLKPLELWSEREEYEPYRNIFKNKVYQEAKTVKYLHTLQHDAEQKLRKNLKKLNIEDWGFGKPIDG